MGSAGDRPDAQAAGFGRTLFLMRWLRRVVATDTESTSGVSGNLDEDDGLTPKQQQENEWARAGWIAVWEPTAGSPGGRRRQYWARQAWFGCSPGSALRR